MPKYVALLAGINLGKRRVKMDALSAHFESMNFTAVETILASGNVIFESTRRSAAALEREIEKQLEVALGFPVATYLRTAREIEVVIAHSPFAEIDPDDKSASVQVMFLKDRLPSTTAVHLSKINTKQDRFGVAGREIYWRVEGRLSDSEIWKSAAIKALKLPTGTVRNINTVRKLAAKAVRKGV